MTDTPTDANQTSSIYSLIGQVVVDYAKLEYLDKILYTVMSIRRPADAKFPRDALEFDHSNILNALKLASTRYSDTLGDFVLDHVNYVEDTLRPLRNQVVHGVWMLNKGEDDIRILDMKRRHDKAKSSSDFKIYQYREVKANHQLLQEFRDAVREERNYSEILMGDIMHVQATENELKRQEHKLADNKMMFYHLQEQFKSLLKEMVEDHKSRGPRPDLSRVSKWISEQNST